MGNVTELSQGSLNGLKKQVCECIDHAQAQGYKSGYDVANNENEMYNQGIEDLSKAIVWYSNLKHSERVKYIGKNLAIHELIENTPQKLIERFKAYEENKQAEDEIKVGDIVRYATDIDKKTAALHKWGNENVADKLQALFERSQEIEDE